jgi:hypothetical protein
LILNELENLGYCKRVIYDDGLILKELEGPPGGPALFEGTEAGVPDSKEYYVICQVGTGKWFECCEIAEAWGSRRPLAKGGS